jgi:hypothetical protein
MRCTNVHERPRDTKQSIVSNFKIKIDGQAFVHKRAEEFEDRLRLKVIFIHLLLKKS